MKYFLDLGYVKLNKYGEELCGDNVEVIRDKTSITMVLADGLGSGVKANILSTLTSKILCKLASNRLPIEESLSTIIATLPVCSVRHVAYSTFTLLHLNDNGFGYLVEFDNPLSILISDGRCVEINRTQKIIENKKVYYTELNLKENDYIVFTSDGVVHAGIGDFLNFGWEREEIIEYINKNYYENMSPRYLASLVTEASYSLYCDKPKDDTTCCCVRVMKDVNVDMMVGPPINPNDDRMVVKKFLENDSIKIVCGGTTSKIVANYLDSDVIIDATYLDSEIPPIAKIKGIDLTTEGVVTLRKLIELSNNYLDNSNCKIKHFIKEDGASRLADLLFEKATKVNIYVGRSINDAHKGLPIDTSMKLKIVEKLEKVLKMLGKEVKVEYY